MARQRDEKLAVAVRAFPALYDKTLPEFHDKNIAAIAWKRVSVKLGLQTGSDAQKSFRNLRKRYAAAKKKAKEVHSGMSSLEKDKQTTELKNYSFLEWLDPFVKNRNTKTNFQLADDQSSCMEEDIENSVASADPATFEETQQCSDSSDDDSAPVQLLQPLSDDEVEHETSAVGGDASDSASPAVSVNPTQVPARKKTQPKEKNDFSRIKWKKKKSKMEDELHAVHKKELDVLKQLETSVAKPKTPEDIFADGVAMKLKQLSNERKLMAQIQIDAILNTTLAQQMGIVMHQQHQPYPVQQRLTSFQPRSQYPTQLRFSPSDFQAQIHVNAPYTGIPTESPPQTPVGPSYQDLV